MNRSAALTLPLRSEWAARILAAGLVLSVLLGVLVPFYRKNSVSQPAEIHARMPEDGGWFPDQIQVVAGQPLHLRLVSDDVLHGFAVGHLTGSSIDLKPGRVVETILVFDQPGTYTYYCTRWCGPNHWRMRGTIEVLPASGEPQPAPPPTAPLYESLGLDIDAPHPADAVPAGRPSAADGVPLLKKLPAAYRSQSYYRANSPAQVWQDLRKDPLTQELTDEQVWNLVAALWLSSTTPERIEQGRTLYSQNCAACHGENGNGQGVFADELTSPGDEHAETIGKMTEQPADFTNPRAMLGASPALLQGKILRGGMGTGMPYWGPVLTDEETWAITEYLWTFQFDMEVETGE